MSRAWNSTFQRSRKPIPKVNEERQKRLRARQFGTDGKREWVVSMRCCVSGSIGTEEWPIDPAHARETRAAGGGPECMVPLWRPVHTDYDSLPEGKFEERWGVSKEWVRQHGDMLEIEWRRILGSGED